MLIADVLPTSASVFAAVAMAFTCFRNESETSEASAVSLFATDA